MNMIYNGVELPALPKDGEYENALIFGHGESITLHFSDLAYTISAIHDELELSGEACNWKKYNLIDGEWVLHSAQHGVYYPGIDRLIWANYDVLGPDGNVYLAASEPMVIFAATHTIHADLLQRGVRPRIDAMQGDSMTRRIEFVLTAGGVPWTPPEGTTAALSYIRPDGVGRVCEKLEDGAETYTICGNIIRMTLLPEVLQVAGDVMAVLQIIRRDDTKLISTFPVEIAVEAEPSYIAQSGGDPSWEPDEPDVSDVPVVPDAPNMVIGYLYGSPIDPPTSSSNARSKVALKSGDTLTYYKGAVLRSIGELGIETHPYIVLDQATQFGYYVWMRHFDLPRIANEAGDIVLDVGTKYLYRDIEAESKEKLYLHTFNEPKEATLSNNFTVFPFWSNYTIYTTDGNVCCEPYDPIPVSGFVGRDEFDIPIFERLR